MRQLDAKQWTLEVIVGLISGVMRVLGAVAAATLLFPAEMSQHFLSGVSICVVTVIAANLVASVRNKIPFITYGIDYTPLFLFSIVGAMLFSRVPENEFMPIFVVFLMAGTLTTGAAFYLVGRFRLSNLARYVPAPVVAGFMGGIGLLIVLQSLANMTGVRLSLATASVFVSPHAMAHWIPGVVFALVLMFGARIIRTTFFPHIIITAAIAIFLAILAMTHTTIHQALTEGWSAMPTSGHLPFHLSLSGAWQPYTVFVLMPHINILLAIVGVSLLSILITLSGLEVSTKRDMVFERELQDAGFANLACGLLGGTVSYHSVPASMTNYEMGGRSRIIPIMTVAVAFVFLAFGWGTAAIGYLPVALLSGLVLYVGLDFVKTWLVDTRLRMTTVEYALLAAIALTTVIWGALLGIVLGIVIAIMLFAVNYSRLRSIELRQTGKSLRSKVERPTVEEETLRRFDDQLRLFRLQGYLFFGSAENIGEVVLNEIRGSEPDTRVPLCVILDFRAVSGIDSSSTLVFSRVFQTASAHGVEVMLVHMTRQIQSTMERSIDSLDSTAIYPDLDDALEAREASILAIMQEQKPFNRSAVETLRQYSLVEEDVRSLIAFFNVQDVPKGEILFKVGDLANTMMIVDTGEFEVYREGLGGTIIRLRKVMTGAILGEMGIYLRGHRTASVRAIEDSRVFVLDDSSLELMHETAPDLALKFNRFIIAVLAARLSHSNNEVLELSGPSP